MFLKRTFEKILNKNNKLKILKQISKILSGKNIDIVGRPVDLTTTDLSSYKFASIISVYVKRYFFI